jgi:hypothetical protein
VFMNDLLLKDSTSQKLDTDLHGRKGGRDRKPEGGRKTVQTVCSTVLETKLYNSEG